MIPTIETERLRLRGWEEKDFPAYAMLRADPVSQAYVGPVMTRSEAWNRFCFDLGFWALRGYGIFAIADKASDEALGYTGIWFPMFLDEPELSWSLFHSGRGRGYATEAAGAARSWAYETLSLPPLMSLIEPDNVASKAVASRLGAVFEKETMLDGATRHLYRHPK
ncbi:MAG: GNAT family N-acetyltransferase [Geminicoccales bacterium]